jgi:exopolyphosphatase/guanosine-5'-triphosphate,3'-diphosphate pyrophosphatase
MRIAAIDIGTVTTRLLVADVVEDGIREVERSTDITHLGENVNESGILSQDAMRRVAAVVGGYARRIGELGVEKLAAVATSASRDASNSETFVSMLDEEGVRPVVVSGDTEARLSFEGATFGMRGDGLLVVDVGGGSTELIAGDAGRGEGGVHIERARSIDVGSRRLTEMFLHDDPPSADQLLSAQAYATEQLRQFFGGGDPKARSMISVAGTATSLAAVHMEMAEYDAARVQGYELSGSDVADLIESLSAMPLSQRRQVVGLHPERASVIVAGALILGVVLALSGLDSTLVSDRDILYGILLDTYRQVGPDAMT